MNQRRDVYLVGLVPLVVLSGFAWVAAGRTDVAITSGEKAHVVRSWPQGTGNTVNDPCRTNEWKPYFTEWPTDVHHYGLVIKSTDELNRIIIRLSVIKGDLKQIRLFYRTETHGLGFVTSLPEGNGIPVMFTTRDQKQIEDWFKQLDNE